MLAPPWIPVPPPAYGGTESVVALLCEELVARGHEVTLFAAPGSSSSAEVRSPLGAAHPEAIGQALYEADHVARAFDLIDREAAMGRPFDVVHDHSGTTALAMSGRLETPMVHTLHGPFSEETSATYACHGQKATLVAISESQRASAPAGVSIACAISNPIAVEAWPFEKKKEDFLLWLGRMAKVKGPHRAIRAATLAARRLVLAGPIQPGQEAFFEAEVEPYLDGGQVQYIGEVGGRVKAKLLASAAALLMPIRWREPFGMVMVEALACGTPVIAFPEGAAKEIVLHGQNGLLTEDERQMARAVNAASGLIDPGQCRESVARYDVSSVAARYEAVYRQVATTRSNGRRGHGDYNSRGEADCDREGQIVSPPVAASR